MTEKIRRRADRPPRTTEEILDNAQRFVRAMGHRVHDPRQLVLLREGVGKALAEAERIGVDQLRAEGFSDRQIAEPMGVTRWAVLRRWPRAPH